MILPHLQGLPAKFTLGKKTHQKKTGALVRPQAMDHIVVNTPLTRPYFLGRWHWRGIVSPLDVLRLEKTQSYDKNWKNINHKPQSRFRCVSSIHWNFVKHIPRDEGVMEMLLVSTTTSVYMGYLSCILSV